MDRLREGQRILELESQVAELKRANAKLMAQVEEFRSKEQTISSAIISSMEHANQLEASRKKLYSLDIQRSRLMYLRMEQVINELYQKYPELKKDPKLKDMSPRFK
jgi:transposase